MIEVWVARVRHSAENEKAAMKRDDHSLHGGEGAPQTTRMADQRRDALDQLRREVAARLETIKLQELTRLTDESLLAEPAVADSPVVFVAPLVQNRLILPWETPTQTATPPAEFVRLQKE